MDAPDSHMSKTMACTSCMMCIPQVRLSVKVSYINGLH